MRVKFISLVVVGLVILCVQSHLVEASPIRRKRSPSIISTIFTKSKVLLTSLLESLRQLLNDLTQSKRGASIAVSDLTKRNNLHNKKEKKSSQSKGLKKGTSNSHTSPETDQRIQENAPISSKTIQIETHKQEANIEKQPVEHQNLKSGKRGKGNRKVINVKNDLDALSNPLESTQAPEFGVEQIVKTTNKKKSKGSKKSSIKIDSDQWKTLESKNSIDDVFDFSFKAADIDETIKQDTIVLTNKGKKQKKEKQHKSKSSKPKNTDDGITYKPSGHYVYIIHPSYTGIGPEKKLETADQTKLNNTNQIGSDQKKRSEIREKPEPVIAAIEEPSKLNQNEVIDSVVDDEKDQKTEQISQNDGAKESDEIIKQEDSTKQEFIEPEVETAPREVQPEHQISPETLRVFEDESRGSISIEESKKHENQAQTYEVLQSNGESVVIESNDGGSEAIPNETNAATSNVASAAHREQDL